MQKIKWPILLVTAYAAFYQLTPYFGFSDKAIMGLYILSPIPVLWMGYKILKNGVPSQRSFDDYFYEDLDYRRNRISDD